VKPVHSDTSAGSLTTRYTSGAAIRMSQIGCVHTCTRLSSVIPKMTSGMIASQEIRQPAHSGIPRPRSKACAITAPSSAKKMNVKL